MSREVTVTYPLAEPPGFLGFAYIKRSDDGMIEIGLLKSDGETVYQWAGVEWDQFWADVQFMQESKP